MILTYKIKHNKNFEEELRKAKLIANFVVEHKDITSSKNVKQFGLKSAISNQIVRKYRQNKIKKAKSVKLTIPNQHIKIDKENKVITITCLNLTSEYTYLRNDFNKINQIEIDDIYAYISMDVNCQEQIKTNDFIGVDLNTTGHCAVVGIPTTGKVIKLGKKAEHIHKKYKEIRRKLQKNKNYRLLKKIKNRESRIVKDLNHKISRKIVDIAKENNCHIKLEKLTGIRKTAKTKKSVKYALNSWSFYQLGQMIEYKSSLLGISIFYIDPAYTSKSCSRCGLIGIRNDKSFKCPQCGHVDNADVNASFNIACRSIQERDCIEGNTDIPNEKCPVGANLRTP